MAERSELADLVGVSEQALLNRMPGSMVFDHPGDGFPDDLMKSAILCTARSGSSLLSIELQAYGFDFQEFLNPAGLLKSIIEGNDVARSSELAPHFVKRAASDGRISIKTTSSGLQYMFAMGEFPLNIYQWRFVYLRRENLVRQAISGFIAVKTGQWTKSMPKKGNIRDSDYSFDEILKLVGNYAQGNRRIERMVGILSLPTFNVVYEEFVADKKRILAEIATFLGCNIADYPEAASHEAWIEQQSTSLNEEWEARFRAEYLEKINLHSEVQSKMEVPETAVTKRPRRSTFLAAIKDATLGRS